jgi:hypothetical protein
MMRLSNWLAAGALALAPTAAMAAKMIVIDARAGALKPGMSVESTAALSLKEGERLTLIGPDGKTLALRGPFSGPPAARGGGGAAADPRQALAALISTRNSRASSIGAVRAGAGAVKLDDPWLIDISRPGPRCLREGTAPIWWRPAGGAAQAFTVFPIDRSWRADFSWAPGQTQLKAPPLQKYDGTTTFIVRSDGQEIAVGVNVIPTDIGDDLVLAAWMLEKGCIPQADALLGRMQTAQAATETASTAQ